VRDAFRAMTRRHRRFPLIRADEYGVALCRLPATFDAYFMSIEAAGRRNVKKAERAGYAFARLDCNAHLADIADIIRSAKTRHASMPDLPDGGLRPCANPPSRSAAHDYPYFGVTRAGRAVAYAGCLVCGEICMIEQILGRADMQADGIVPMLIIGVARHVIRHHPLVKYYSYGLYFGANETMRRFKRKFRFEPHKVKWVLG